MSVFENAPVSLLLVVSSLLLSYLLQGTDVDISLGRVLSRGEVGRLFWSQFVFHTVSQAFFGAIVLFNCRLFERQLGIKKYGAFFLISLLITLLLNLIVSLLFELANVAFPISSGPYFFIFAQIALFHKYVPKVSMTQYVFLGIPFSEKSWTYLLAVQLLLGEGLHSIIPAATGLLAGYLYDKNIFRLQSLRLPAVAEKCLRGVSGLLGTTSSTARIPAPAAGAGAGAGAVPVAQPHQRRMFDEDDQYSMYGSMANNGADFGLPPPDEESITTIMGLGFDREQAVRALTACGNNVEAAANRLLS